MSEPIYTSRTSPRFQFPDGVTSTSPLPSDTPRESFTWDQEFKSKLPSIESPPSTTFDLTRLQPAVNVTQPGRALRSPGTFSGTTYVETKMSLNQLNLWISRFHEQLVSAQAELNRISVHVEEASAELISAQKAYSSDSHELANTRVLMSITPESGLRDSALLDLSNRTKTTSDALDAAVRELAAKKKEAQAASRAVSSAGNALSLAWKQVLGQIKVLPGVNQDEQIFTLSSDALEAIRDSTDDPAVMSERYYDEAAKVKEYGERLVDADYCFQEDSTARQERRDQGLEPTLADEAFYQDYRNNRAEIERMLDAAIDAADHLKAACEARGIAIDESTYDSDSMALGPGASHNFDSAPNENSPGISGHDGSLRVEDSVVRPLRLELNNWLGDISGNDMGLPLYGDDDKTAGLETLSWLSIHSNSSIARPSYQPLGQLYDETVTRRRGSSDSNIRKTDTPSGSKQDAISALLNHI